MSVSICSSHLRALLYDDETTPPRERVRVHHKVCSTGGRIINYIYTVLQYMMRVCVCVAGKTKQLKLIAQGAVTGRKDERTKHHHTRTNHHLVLRISVKTITTHAHILYNQQFERKFIINNTSPEPHQQPIMEVLQYTHTIYAIYSVVVIYLLNAPYHGGTLKTLFETIGG